MTSERSSVRAACYIGGGTLEVIAKEPCEPGDGEVAIDVAYTGICGTDLHILHGAMDARVTLPAVLGHEMSGTIAAIGNGVSGRSIGERVTVMPLAPCGDCPACRAGYSHICHNLDFLGIDSPGAMQSSWTVPQDPERRARGVRRPGTRPQLHGRDRAALRSRTGGHTSGQSFHHPHGGGRRAPTFGC